MAFAVHRNNPDLGPEAGGDVAAKRSIARTGALIGCFGLLAVAGCGDDTPPPGKNNTLTSDCSDLFDQSVVQQYWIDMHEDDLDSMMKEFQNVSAVLAGQ